MAHELQSAAIVMRRCGGPDVLRQEIVASPSLRPDEIRIRSIGSAVNHSDLEIRAGNWLSRGPTLHLLRSALTPVLGLPSSPGPGSFSRLRARTHAATRQRSVRREREGVL
jgi:hypothetical protein